MAVFPIGGIARARKAATQRIAERVADAADLAPEPVEIEDETPEEEQGEHKDASLVVPLNAGHFHLEAMRQAAVTKKRAALEQRQVQGRE